MTGKSRKQQIEELLADDPNDPFLRYGLAMECVSAGDDAGAVRCFGDLVDATPDYLAAYLQSGQAYVRLGQAEEARAILRRGIAVARRQGEQHAGEELQGLLDSLG